MTRRRKIAVLLVLVLGLPVLLVAMALGALRSPAGRDAAVGYLAAQLSSPETGQVYIGKLGGSLFGRLTVAEVSLSDPEGEWLRLEDLAIAWQPRELLSGRLRVSAIEAGEIDLRRLPEGPKETGASGPAKIPSPPLSIALERLAIGEVRIGESVLGESAAFGLQASAAAPTAGAFQATIEATRVDGQEGRLKARAGLEPEQALLHLEIELSEPAGGVIARLLDLPGLPAVKLDLAGSGGLRDWRGQLKGEATGLAEIAANLKLDAGGLIVVEADGEADIAELLDEPFRAFLADVTGFSLKAQWDGAAADLVLDRVAVENAVLKLEGSGRLKDETLDARLEAHALSPEPYNRLIAPAGLAELSLAAHLAGPLTTPRVELDARLGRVRAPGVDAGEARLHLALVPEGPLDAQDPTIALDGRLETSALRLEQAEAAALTGSSPNLTLQGRFSINKLLLQLDRARLNGEAVTLETAGTVDLKALGGRLEGTLSLPQLAALSGAAGVPLQGTAAFKFHLAGANFQEQLDLDLEGDLQELAFGAPDLEELLGPQIEVSALLRHKADGLELSDLRLAARSLQLSGGARLPAGAAEVDADYRLEMADIAALSGITGLTLSGAAHIEGRAVGKLQAPLLEGKLGLSDASLQTIAVPRLSLDYVIEDPLGSPGGTLAFDLRSTYGEIRGQSRFRLPERQSLVLTDIALHSRNGRVTGDVTLPFAAPILEGRLQGRTGPLQSWSDLAGLAMSGDVTFDATLRESGGKQAGRLTLSGENLQVSDISAGRLQVSAEAEDIFAKLSGTVSASAGSVILGPASLADAKLEAVGSPTAATVALELNGDLNGPLDLQIAGDVVQDRQALRVDLRTLEGKVIGRPIALRQPLKLRYARDDIEVADLALRFDGGQIDGSAKMTSKTVALDIKLKELPLSLAALALPDQELDGQLDGTLSLAGPLQSPKGGFRLEARDIAVPAELAAPLPEMRARVSGTVEGGKLAVEGNVAGLAGSELRFQASLPMKLSMEPPEVALPEGEPISGSLSFAADTARVAPLFLPEEHQLSGQATAEIKLAGSLSAPALTGDIRFSDGSYENIDAGSLLKDVQLTIAADGTRLEVTQLTATDGGTGRISGGGVIDIVQGGVSLDLEVAIQEASLVNRDDISVTAGGDITLKGTSQDAKLAGRIETQLVEARISGDLPPDVVALEVEEIRVGAPPEPPPPKAPAAPAVIRLDLDLSMPRRVFIRGRGLDSEWSGEFKITGTADRPVIEGTLKPVRGQFSFAGKIFKLQEGSIYLPGGADINPTLDLSAEYKGSDFTAIVSITGKASEPKILLSSKPQMPEDEIVSRILFGKSAGKLSGLEALQLAAAVAELTGVGPSGGNLLDRVRSAVGVDVLRVETDEATGAAAVSVGRYVGESVYVGVEQGAEPNSTAATVEVEIFPNVTVETDVGQDAQGKVGVKWKLDY